MKSFKLSSVVLVAITLGLTGCGQGFQAASAPTDSANNGSSSIGGPSGSGGSQDAFKALAVDGTVSSYPDTQVIELDKTNMMLIVRLPSPLPVSTFTTVSAPINQIPGATVSVEPLASGGSALVLRLPLSAVVKGVAFAAPSKLPNGDPLPGVPDGELPAVAVTLSRVGSINPTIYLGPSVVGIYVNSPTAIPAIPVIGSFTLPIRNAAHTRTWGYVSTVPAKTSDKGGFFVSLALPDDIARVIDDVL
jgi:hypothetical protein